MPGSKVRDTSVLTSDLLHLSFSLSLSLPIHLSLSLSAHTSLCPYSLSLLSLSLPVHLSLSLSLSIFRSLSLSPRTLCPLCLSYLTLFLTLSRLSYNLNIVLCSVLIFYLVSLSLFLYLLAFYNHISPSLFNPSTLASSFILSVFCRLR